MIGEFYTPPMHRDLMSSGMPMFEFEPEMMGMGSMYGGMGFGMYGNTNLLGGVRLQPNLNRDTVQILRAKEKETNDNMLSFAKFAFGVIAISTLAGLFKGKKTPWTTKASNWISGHKLHRPVGSKTWFKPWTWFNKTPAATP